MSRRRLLPFALAVLAGVAAGCAHAGLKVGPTKDGQVVDAEGWSPVDPKDPIGTRQRALVEAQKKAVEQVVGVYISAKTQVDQAVTVNERILANMGGYIKTYQVLSDKEEGGFHKTRIRALVLYQKIGADLRDAGLIRPAPPPGNPKVAVIVKPRPGMGVPQAWADSAAAAIRSSLLNQGFTVIDLNDPASQQAVVIASTDPAVVALAGLRLQADLVVSGQVSGSSLEDSRLGDFKSFRARLTLQVIKPATKEVLADKSQEAAAIDPSPDMAASKAMENAGQLAGEALASDLQASLNSRQSILVKVAGFSGLDSIQKFADDLRSTPGVVDVAFSGFADGTAALSVTTDQLPGDQLSATILRMPQHKFQILSVNSYEVDLQGS